MRDAVMTLAGGRMLAYTDLGEPAGFAAMCFHAAPTSRSASFGMGTSSWVRGFVWCRPAVPAMAAPRRGRAGRCVSGLLMPPLLPAISALISSSSSGYRRYAVAWAALGSDGGAGAGVLNGVTGMGWAPAWDGCDPLMRVGDEAAAGGWLGDTGGAVGPRLLSFATDLVPADAALLEDRARAETLLATIAEWFRRGAGLTVQGRPWPCVPAAAAAAAIVLHGELDPCVPVAHGRHTAEAGPGARLVLLPGQGHVSLVREIPCAGLRSASKGAAR